MQIPSIHSLFNAKLTAIGLPERSDTGFADTLADATSAETNQTPAQITNTQTPLGGLMYSLVPNVHYTLEPETATTAQLASAASISDRKDAQASASLGASLSNYATQFVGNPYVWGGEDPVNGADCSGFTQTIYRTFGMDLPRTAYRQSLVGREVSPEELQPGDLLCFQNTDESQVGHVGIYLGNGKFVHAANSKLGIITSDLSKWTDRLKTIRRLPELEPAVG